MNAFEYTNKQTNNNMQNRDVILFDNNLLLPDLFGIQNANLHKLEELVDVKIANRGNKVFIHGTLENISLARQTLLNLYQHLTTQKSLEIDDVERILLQIRLQNTHPLQINDSSNPMNANNPCTYPSPKDALELQLNKRAIKPSTQNQACYLDMMMKHHITFAIGPAGTGKTWLGVAYGLSLLLNGVVNKMVITRPAVEAGERLGFLPGDMHNKLEPYLRPIDDAICTLIGKNEMQKRSDANEIEIAPLAYMRGRTLSNAFILMDEAQNTTIMQMKMFLTRLGPASHMVITGDPSQADLPTNQISGLTTAIKKLNHISDIAVAYFDSKDVQRHRLVTQIIDAFETTDLHHKQNLHSHLGS